MLHATPSVDDVYVVGGGVVVVIVITITITRVLILITMIMEFFVVLVVIIMVDVVVIIIIFVLVVIMVVVIAVIVDVAYTLMPCTCPHTCSPPDCTGVQVGTAQGGQIPYFCHSGPMCNDGNIDDGYGNCC